jgi:hypothetical protein
MKKNILRLMLAIFCISAMLASTSAFTASSETDQTTNTPLVGEQDSVGASLSTSTPQREYVNYRVSGTDGRDTDSLINDTYTHNPYFGYGQLRQLAEVIMLYIDQY